MRKNINKYDVIVVLGVVMEWNKKRKTWEFPTIIQRYPGKLVMGRMRAQAAAKIHDLANKILVTGGSDRHPQTGRLVSRSKQLTKLITEYFRVPKNKVVAVGSMGASHTLGNVEDLVVYLKKHPKIIYTKRLAILCPRFQRKRAKIMFGLNPYFRKRNIKLTWLLVEDILEKNDKRWRKRIKKIYRSPEAKICRELEKKGISDLSSGRYKPAKN